MILEHGTSTTLSPGIGGYLLPPSETGVSPHFEESRKERDKVFSTRDNGYARVYAGRAVACAGGYPVILSVWIPDDQVEVMSSKPGASVFSSPAAFVLDEKLI